MMADVMMVRNMGLSSVDGETLGVIRFFGCDAHHDHCGFDRSAMLFGAAFDVQLNHPLNQLNRFASVLKQFFKKWEKIREIREVIKIFESLSDQSDSAALEV